MQTHKNCSIACKTAGFGAGIRAVSSSSSATEQPLQSVSAAKGNIQPEDPVPVKVSSQANRAGPESIGGAKAGASQTHTVKADVAAAGTEHSQAEATRAATTSSKLFATAGHEVTSFVADDEEGDSSSGDNGQQTVSTTPYDELD